jgi:L-rhamnonate dehydratase
VKISDVRPYLLRGEERYGSNAGGDEATDQGDWLLLVRVRVIKGDGMSALGFRTLDELLVGRELDDQAQIWDELFIGTAYYGRRGVAVQAISAVDNCLWSIRAQAAGVPLSALLGGARRDRLPAYASTLFRRTPDDNAAAARGYVERGFTGVKFGWGGFGTDAALDADNVAAIRDSLGADRTLMVDPGWYVSSGGRARLRTAEETRTMLEGLTVVHPYWVEDFVHPECTDDYQMWKRAFPDLRFAAGEQQATVWELRRLVRSTGVDVVQPDLSRCGGLSVARQLVLDAEECGVELVTHSWLTDLLHSYSLHFLSTLPSATWVEFNVAQSSLTRGAVRGRLTMGSDGTVEVPSGIGIGVEVDPDFVKARAVTL